MINPIENLDKVLLKPPAVESVSRNSGGNSVTGLPQDTVDLNSNSLLDSIRVQAGTLKQELPGIIANSLLAPVADEVVRQNPLNNLIFRLENPLDSILGQLPLEGMPENLILGLQKEIQNLKNAIPELRVHELLTQFSSDLSTADSLNDILFSLTDWTFWAKSWTN